MLDPSAQAAPLPQDVDPAMLAQILGAAGDPSQGGLPADPSMGGMPPGGMPPGGPDPSMGMAPAGGNPYPTTDPKFMAQALSQLVQMQQQDSAQMQSDQQSALTGNPIFQALSDGAPMGPGAGQDGAAIGVGGELSAPPGMGG